MKSARCQKDTRDARLFSICLTWLQYAANHHEGAVVDSQSTTPARPAQEIRRNLTSGHAVSRGRASVSTNQLPEDRDAKRCLVSDRADDGVAAGPGFGTPVFPGTEPAAASHRRVRHPPSRQFSS